jgi:hypothetical protein
LLLGPFPLCQIFRRKPLAAARPHCSASRADQRSGMERPFENGRVRYRFDRCRTATGAASTSEKNEREIRPRRLVRYRLAQPRSVQTEERIIGEDGARS